MSLPLHDGSLPTDIVSCRSAVREAGLRATPGRAAVLQIIRQSDRPLSHANVCALVGENAWNRSTTWRNLCDLERVGLIQRTDLGDRRWRFEQAAADDSHGLEQHPHFVCTSCGAISCLPEELVALPQKSGLPRAVQEGQVIVQVRGLCDDCD